MAYRSNTVATIRVRRSELRAEYPRILVGPSTTSKAPLHVPQTDDEKLTYCHHSLTTDPEKLQWKPVSVYPPGWRDWCGACLYVRKFGEYPNNSRFRIVYSGDEHG